MSHLFNITIATEHGDSTGTCRANSLQQISDVMPDDVKHYEAVLVPMKSDDAVVDDEELMLDFLRDVSNIEYASTMTPERIEEEHAKQRRALRGLTFRLASSSTNE